MSELIITEKTNITAIADAVRNKTGSSSGLTLNGIIEGINSISGEGTSINLDEEITTQENTITSQDTLIADIVSALEGKAAGGGSENNPLTRTININWDEDREGLGEITYLSNGEVITKYNNTVDTIEADYGVVVLNSQLGYGDNTFITLYDAGYNGHILTLIATQDNGTIYVVSSEQAV